MKRIEYTHTNKLGWGDGPWMLEPDKVQWLDEETGLPCLINRGPAGAWCGYVGVNQQHPCYGKDYNDVYVDVHGGLTFCGPCQVDEKEHGICHVVEEGEDDSVWWIGFDCYHAWDFAPGMTPWRVRERHDVYRDQAYVTGEVKQLAKQLKEITNENVNDTDAPGSPPADPQ